MHIGKEKHDYVCSYIITDKIQCAKPANIAMPIANNPSNLRYVCLEHYEKCRPRTWLDEQMEKLGFKYV